MLKPQAIFRDPFRPTGKNILVLCDCYLPNPNAPDGCVPSQPRRATLPRGAP